MRKPAKTMISIRLPTRLLEDLKLLAKLKGVRYQTLINLVLTEEAMKRSDDIGER